MIRATQFLWVGFFRGAEHARAAIQDLMYVGVPPDVICVIGGSGNAETTARGISALGMAEREERFLAACVEQGGIVIVVPPHAVYHQEVEAIFLRHQAAQDSETAIYECGRTTDLPSLRWNPTSGCA